MRLGRAATFAFGAAMATTLSACGGNVVALYGAPPPDAASEADASGSTDAGTTPTDDAAAPVDAAAEVDGGLVAAYGGPPTDAGIRDVDAGGSSSDYGAPPPP